MNEATFKRLREIVYETSGISLSPAKRALLMARTGKRMRALGITDFDDYLEVLESEDTGRELVEFLDAVSTNVTSFFREPSHFDVVREVARSWAGGGTKSVRLWSAGCSTGEEAYSLAMTVFDVVGGGTLDVRILATDICTDALRAGARGVYSRKHCASIPPKLRKAYAEPTMGDDEVYYRIGKRLRDAVVFRRLNLKRTPYPLHGPLDMVFCRNVMIYFDQEMRELVLREFHRLLRRGGLLFVGHAESMAVRSELFSLLQPSVLVKD